MPCHQGDFISIEFLVIYWETGEQHLIEQCKFADTFFGSMRPHTQVNSKLSLRSPSRGRKEQKLFFPFARNSANTGGV